MKLVPSPFVVRGPGADAATSTVNTLETISAAWDPLLDKIGRFTEIVDGISEVHPYAKMAWSILSIAHKTIIAQKDRDDSINELAKVIRDTYALVHLVEPLKKIESQRQVIISLTNLTVECGYFIRDYAKIKNFWKRAAKNVVSDVDSKVTEYQESFNKLKLNLEQHAVIHTEVTVLRVLNVVEAIATEVLLNDMPYAGSAGCNPKKGCLPGTREKVIEEICNWANQDSDDTPRIFFLHDIAGASKSAIAHEVARQFDRLKRLGSSYCFDHALQAERSPENVFSTIAHDLADLDPPRKASLAKVVGQQRALRTTCFPDQQFQRFILDASRGLTTIGPTVIVIGALDESGDQKSRKDLLSVLRDEAAGLLPNFRVLITSRAEKDILGALHGKEHVRSMSLNEIDPNPVDDIARFVKHELDNITDLECKWPDERWCRLLAEKSEGHFQWASTACRFVQGGGKGGRDPVEQLDGLLDEKIRGMDNLYLGILKQTFEAGDGLTDKVKGRFCSVMGCILTAREPLSMSALQDWCKGGNSGTKVQLIVGPMGALLSLPSQESGTITLLHTSFRDFLTDHNRSGAYYIDMSDKYSHHDNLALSCLRVMKDELRFNICQLQTSHLRNDDVVNLAIRTKNMPPQLSYSCRFWADHVCDTKFTPDIGAKVEEFFETKLLEWLEVLSLIKKVPDASAALLSMIDWSQDEDIAAFATDALNFAHTFGSVISQSAPHLYLLALLFSPERSKVCETYLPRFPRLLWVKTGKATTWPPIQTVLVGHTSGVTSVAFLHDGKRIASGSGDKTIRVWNADTGEAISAPFAGQDATGPGFRHDSRLENGWILNSPSERLFWVPPWSRLGLWWPVNTAVIGEGSTKLDLSWFEHGTSWMHCREAP